MNKNILYISIPIATIDQISKLLADSYLDKIEIIKDFFYLNLVHNRGAAWGMLTNHVVFLSLFMIVDSFL